MLEVLEAYLNRSTTVKCVVGAWIAGRPEEEQALFEQLQQNKIVSRVNLYEDLKKEVELPFKLTAFRVHMRGACGCQ